MLSNVFSKLFIVLIILWFLLPTGIAVWINSSTRGKTKSILSILTLVIYIAFSVYLYNYLDIQINAGLERAGGK